MRKRIVRHLQQMPADAVFVQVGSNDGKRGDPIFPFASRRSWRGVVIEPVPYIFERLVETYREHPKVTPVQVAIGEAGAEAPFYYIDEVAGKILRLHRCYDQIGSFSKDHIYQHFGPEIESCIRVLPVVCQDLESVMSENNLDLVDIIHVDAEGLDLEVLRQIDFSRRRPRLILYEHKHLRPADRRAARAHLKKNGFRTIIGPYDTMGVRR